MDSNLLPKIVSKSALKLSWVEMSAKLDFEDPSHVFSWFSLPTCPKKYSKKLYKSTTVTNQIPDDSLERFWSSSGHPLGG